MKKAKVYLALMLTLVGMPIPAVLLNEVVATATEVGGETGDTGSNGGTGVMPVATVRPGDSFRIPTSAYTREGYQLVEWNTSPDGSGTSYSPGDTIENVSFDMMLYAERKEGFEAIFTIGSTTYSLNGVEQTMDIAPYTQYGIPYIPLRVAAFAMGVDEKNMIFDQENGTLELKMDAGPIVVDPGRKTLYVNGETIYMDMYPKFVDPPGEIMFPVHWLAIAPGCQVDWVGVKITIH